MIQKMVSAVGGVGGLGEISICLFFAVFGGALIWAFGLKKPFLSSMESLPLRDDEPGRDGEGVEHHE